MDTKDAAFCVLTQLRILWCEWRASTNTESQSKEMDVYEIFCKKIYGGARTKSAGTWKTIIIELNGNECRQ